MSNWVDDTIEARLGQIARIHGALRGRKDIGTLMLLNEDLRILVDRYRADIDLEPEKFVPQPSRDALPD